MDKIDRWILVAMLMIGIVISGKAVAQAATLEVGTAGSGYPYTKIQDAIDVASDGDTVLVHDGTYVENIDLHWGWGITVRSDNGPDVTIIDGNQNGSVVTFVENGSSVLDGFSIINGTGTDEYGKTCGGGIYCIYSSPKIINCNVTGNSAEKGGGIFIGFESESEITNCTITGNTANGIDWDCGGGGIYYDYYPPCIIGTCSYLYSSIINCTISDNSADRDGGGIYCFGYILLTVINSILWGDTACGNSNEISFITSNISVTYSDIQGGFDGTCITCIDDDPRFVGGGDYHLTPGSPCIDKGTSTVAPADDIDGDPRPQCTAYDMGSDEFLYDLDCDGDVDFDDLDIVTDCFGKTASECADPRADVNGDGMVNILDVSLVVSNFT